MDPEVLNKYRESGRILSAVLAEVKRRVEPDATLLEIAELVEGGIRARGGEPAFPCNISLDRAAAHYTPAPGDTRTFGESMAKLDIGVHMDGYIADAAVTVDRSGHSDMVEAAEAALAAAIDAIIPGVQSGQIGAAIEEAISGYGYKPVSNLTGHGLERYHAHSEPTIPNRASERGIELKEGDVIAIEPFASNGLGRISEAPIVEIYGFIESRPVRHPQARELMKEIGQKYKTLPFARRWLKGERVDFALAQLLKNGIIHKYPVLWEIEGALVSQAEHTVIVSENGCEVITAP